jgi:hypothetical protein
MKATPLSWSATASDFDKRRARHQVTVASLYGTPAILLNIIEDPKADPAKLLQLFQKCGLKWLNTWVQEANRKLLTKNERLNGYGWKVDYQALLEADPSGRADYYSRLFPLGVFSPNQILSKEGENPYPEGDKRFVQGAMRPIDEPYNATSPQNPPVDPKLGKRDPLKQPKPKVMALKIGARTMLQDCIQRLTAKESKAARANITNPKWIVWAEAFCVDHAQWATKELKNAVDVCAIFNLKETAKELASRLAEQTRLALVEVGGERPDVFAAKVETWATEWERDRAAAFVRTIVELN